MCRTSRTRTVATSAAALALALCTIPPAVSGAAATQEALRHSADAVTVDFRSDTLSLSGNVRVTQGPMSIEAQTATGVGTAAENSRWTFQESVHIRTAEADLQADTATATIVAGEIANARIEGSPAVFEQRNSGEGRQVRGRAGTIEYDFTSGIVKLTDQVWFSNGKDEFRGDVVIYNVRDERVQINPAGQSRGRVRGIIRPDKTEAAQSAPPGADATPAQPDGAAGSGA